MPPLVECVPNVSEGRDAAKIDAMIRSVEEVPGALLLDRHSDADHNRTVATFAGSPEAVAEAAFRLVESAAALIDLARHKGAHPRIGAADVVPFIPIEGITIEDCAEIAGRVGRRIWNELHIPVFLYEAAARRPERVSLANVRRGQFEALFTQMGEDRRRAPDIGDPVCHPTAGAVAVGARKFLIACNVNLKSPDIAIARRIARAVRFSSGGLPCVKAMGVMLASRGLAQVSMNLTDFEVTPIHVALEAVRHEAERLGAPVLETEIVGLVPRKALEGWGDQWSGQVLEDRIAEAISRRLRKA
jgi:glutamate formiminotransferase